MKTDFIVGLVGVASLLAFGATPATAQTVKIGLIGTYSGPNVSIR